MILDDVNNNYVSTLYFREVTKIKDNSINKKKDCKIKNVCLNKSCNYKNDKISNYIIVKTSYTSIKKSKFNCKSSDHYVDLEFAGLNQNNVISSKTYEILKKFIDRFKILSLDISIDGLSPCKINKSTMFYLNDILDPYIGLDSNTQLIETSFYINNPIAPSDDTKKFDKILFYDKYLKDGVYKDWKRIEVTISIDDKFKELTKTNLNDYIQDCKRLANKIFGYSINLDTSLIDNQKEWFNTSTKSNKKDTLEVITQRVKNLQKIFS